MLSTLVGFYRVDRIEKSRFARSKIYTPEELHIVNILITRHTNRLKGVKMEENELINVINKNIIIYLPRLDSSEQPARINWLKQLEGDYYLAGLTYIEHGSPSLGCTEWMLKRDDEVGFTPMFCSLYWTEEGEVIKDEQQNEK